ncbi:MAG: glycosyltransferase family 4 protein [Lachnospiraceae bacterium]|nr:glycosyltransferase family 4 protein [Lachnospiraceae bacterium]
MKILYVTTVSITMSFFEAHFRMLLEEGHTVELACNCEEPLPDFCVDMGLKVYSIPFSRSPLSKDNLTAAGELKKVVEAGHYDIVHTHTPTASACVRLVCRKFRKQGLKVFYTAHGFHFYQGAPAKNWLLFYPVEWLCAHWTDVLITINKEDFERAKRSFRAGKVLYIPGVGIDLEKFGKQSADRTAKRRELGIPEDAVLLLSVGELNENKNHETMIKALKGMDIYYCIAGQGDKESNLRKLASELGMENRVKLLGYRKDVRELYQTADAFVFPSYREGLSVSLMEAMASGLPCVASRIRGNTDLIDEKGGVLFDPHSTDQASQAVRTLLAGNRRAMGEYNMQKVRRFSTQDVICQLRDVYAVVN